MNSKVREIYFSNCSLYFRKQKEFDERKEAISENGKQMKKLSRDHFRMMACCTKTRYEKVVSGDDV